MSKAIGIGDRVIGMTRLYHEPIEGIVIHNDLKVDPLHPILVNVNPSETIVIKDSDDFDAKFPSIRNDVEFLSDRHVFPYSKKNKKNLQRLLRITESKKGRAYLDSDTVLEKFFEGKKRVASVKLELFLKSTFNLIKRILNVFIFGTLELLFVDLIDFYRKKTEIYRLNQEKMQQERNKYIAETFLGYRSDERKEIVQKCEQRIEKINSQVNQIGNDRKEMSRAFLALLIAIAGIIIAIAKD